MTTFLVETRAEGRVCVVRLEGACDIAVAPRLREALAELRPPDVTTVVLDTEALEYIDSTGLGVVLGALRRLREGGGTLRIAGARGAVRRVLEVTDLDKVIPLYEDVAAATEAES